MSAVMVLKSVVNGRLMVLKSVVQQAMNGEGLRRKGIHGIILTGFVPMG